MRESTQSRGWTSKNTTITLSRSGWHVLRRSCCVRAITKTRSGMLLKSGRSLRRLVSSHCSPFGLLRRVARPEKKVAGYRKRQSGLEDTGTLRVFFSADCDYAGTYSEPKGRHVGGTKHPIDVKGVGSCTVIAGGFLHRFWSEFASFVPLSLISHFLGRTLAHAVFADLVLAPPFLPLPSLLLGHIDALAKQEQHEALSVHLRPATPAFPDRLNRSPVFHHTTSAALQFLLGHFSSNIQHTLYYSH